MSKLKLYLVSEVIPAFILCGVVWGAITLFDKYVAPYWFYAKIF